MALNAWSKAGLLATYGLSLVSLLRYARSVRSVATVAGPKAAVSHSAQSSKVQSRSEHSEVKVTSTVTRVHLPSESDTPASYRLAQRVDSLPTIAVDLDEGTRS